VTAPTYALLGTSLLVRVLVSFEAGEGNDSADAMPWVIFFSLALAWIIHSGDPLKTYGLSMLSLLGCPWISLFLLWATAFTTGRVANALLLHPSMGFRKMVASGHISPGGVYLSLRDYPKLRGLILGFPMICSQTFMEEFIFRGLLISLGNWVCGLLKVSPQLSGFLSAVGSSILFGLIHFVPAFCCLKGESIVIPLYAFIMPTALGMAFAVLNQASCSLWPGWIAHFGLNYSGFMWDRLSGRWEAEGLR